MATQHDMVLLADADILSTVIDAVIARGWKMNVDNGGDGFELELWTQDKAKITDAMTGVDMATLHIRGTDMGRDRLGLIRFVYGEDGYDVMQDYSVWLSPLIEAGPVAACVERWELAVAASDLEA